MSEAPEMEKTKYNHAEAFCLMWYACGCGHRERIWNSRDGVTPFGLTCPSCGKIMDHVDWWQDQCEPKHKLVKGQRFWRDGTPEDASKIIQARAGAYRKLGNPIPAHVEARMLKSAIEQIDQWQPGWPMLDIAS